MSVELFTPRSLPSIPAPASLAGVLHDVRAFNLKYVVLSMPQATILAPYILMTHAAAAFDFTAYVHVTSPMPECGKTRQLEVMEALVKNPWLTGRVTPAVLMRKIDAEAPVLLLDETDAAFAGDPTYSEALRGMLNAGFHRTGKASVCVGQGSKIEYKDFSVFGPKVIAGIGRLPGTVESRSIPITLRRRTKSEVVSKWRRRESWSQAKEIRDRITTVMTSSVIETLRAARPMIPAGLSDRAEDVLEPLLAIADLAGGEWPEAVRAAAVALMGMTARTDREADQSLPLELLADIRQIFADRGNTSVLETKFIIEGLVGMDDRPWATFTKSDKPITPHRLARILKTFEIEPPRKGRDGAKTFRGYRYAAFEDAFSRYLGSEVEQSGNTNKTNDLSPKTEAEHAVAVPHSKTAENPDKHWSVPHVPSSTPDKGDDGLPADFVPPMGISREAWAKHKAGMVEVS